MLLTLNTIEKTASATMGELLVDGLFECLTLEDPVREDPNPDTPENEAKVMHKTAIPAGRYRVIVNVSPRFGKLLPRLMDVPGFTGILIHSGNTVEDTSGCILVGDKLNGESIAPGTSAPAFKRLFSKINNALAKGEEVWITIKRGAE